MSPSVYVIARDTKTGKRWHVRYRLGGRYAPIQHGGAFKTRKDALARQALISYEIAAGRDPRAALAALGAPPVIPRTFSEDAARWLAGRINVSPRTLASNRAHVAALDELIGQRPTDTLTAPDLQAQVIAPLADRLQPSTLRLYVATLRMILDDAGIDPNPARALKLPRVDRTEPQPPTASEVLAILEHIHKPWLLPLLVMEQTALRVGEVVALTWGDVDQAGHRVRVRAASAKTRRARWAQVPAWLMDAIARSCPPDDRTPTWPVFTGNANACKNAMLRACARAGISAYSPHDLRHRRLSLWHGQGIPARELAHRAGHANASMTLSVYSHVMPLDEIQLSDLKEILHA